MRTPLKEYVRALVPPILLRTYQDIRFNHLPPAIRTEATRNQTLKQRHKDQRCFVIGTGPSLGSQDLTPLKEEIVFACNFFNLHPQCETISPRYYFIVDWDAYFDQGRPVGAVEKRDQWFSDLSCNLPKTEFIAPWVAKDTIERRGWFPRQTVWYWLGLHSLRLGNASFDIRQLLTIGPCNTLTDVMLPMALYMGFSKIYLLGCDCDWWLNPLSRDKSKDAPYHHFYSHNPYLNRETRVGDICMEDSLTSLAWHFKLFRLLGELARSMGVTVCNATRGGLLDVFPRVDFEKCFSFAREHDGRARGRSH